MLQTGKYYLRLLYLCIKSCKMQYLACAAAQLHQMWWKYLPPYRCNRLFRYQIYIMYFT